MKVIWLGQNGFLFVSGKNKVLIDPYLSDSLKDIDSRMERGWSINKRFLEVEPDVIVLTNSHMDHTDIATLRNYIERNKYQTTLLCCESAFNIIASSGIIGRYNNVLMENGSQWTHDHLVFEAVPAKTDDKTAIGVIITDNVENKKYYITSDTLYNRNIFRHIPRDIEALFLPINGEDGGMNMDDAERFARQIDAIHTVPVHFGMFDDVNPKKFKAEGAVIPEIYRIIPLSSSDRAERRRLSLRKLLASEERDMKLRLSEKSLKVEDSKIVSDTERAESGAPEERPLPVTETRSEPTATVKDKIVYDPLPAREAGLSYLQALKERQRIKESNEKSPPLAENSAKTEKIESKSEEKPEAPKPAVLSSFATENTLCKTEEDASAVEKTAEETCTVCAEKETPDISDSPEIITDENFDFTAEIDMSFVESFTAADCEKKEDRSETFTIEDMPDECATESLEENTEEYEYIGDGKDSDGEEVPPSFDPFAGGDFESTFEIDSARGALAYETLESIREITEEYDNVDGDEEVYEPYDDSEDEEADAAIEAEIPEEADEFEGFEPYAAEDPDGAENLEDIAVPADEEADSDSEIDSYAEIGSYNEIDSDDEIDADEELIYSDIEEDSPYGESDEGEESGEAEDSSGGEKPDNSLLGFDDTDGDDEDMSEKIDAYIKELEKFERGDTVDFSKIEF